MPELPEVEASRNLLSQACCGLKIDFITCIEQGGGPRDGKFDDIVFSNISEGDMKSALIGKTLVAVRRKGKQLWFEILNMDVAILFHFGMTGAFVLQGYNAPQYKSFKISKDWPPKFTKLEIVFKGGLKLAFCDPRRLGRIQLRHDAINNPPISILARDPYLDGVNENELRTKLSQYTTSIKAALLDQEKIFSGIGNWVADETLYHAKIHPSTPCCNIAHNEYYLRALCSSLVMVINTAVEVGADSDRFPADWLFHYRWNKKHKILPNGNFIISYHTPLL